MSEFRTAVAFLTRIPVSRERESSAARIGRSTLWFPAVGLFVGASHLLTLTLLDGLLPSSIVAICILIVDVLLTGGLHMDGLADTADGFGGGWTKTEVLDIMRDHAIGAYGAMALILFLALKATLIATIIDAPDRVPLFLAAPVVGRWSSVVLSFALPYARTHNESVGAASAFVGRRELLVATTVCLAVVIVAFGARSLLFAASALLITACWGVVCHRTIQGVTGDTLGTSIAVTEVVILFIGAVR